MSENIKCISHSVSLPSDLVEKAKAKAKREDRSFSYIVQRAIKIDLEKAGVLTPPLCEPSQDIRVGIRG